MPQDTARYWNMLEDLDAVQDAMSATEAAFVEDLLTRRAGGCMTLTKKQKAVIARMADKYFGERL